MQCIVSILFFHHMVAPWFKFSHAHIANSDRVLLNVFSLSSLYLLPKKHLKQSFCYTHLQPYWLHWGVHLQSLNPVVVMALLLFTSLLTKYLKKRQITVRYTTFPQLYCLEFHSNRLIFLTVMQNNQRGCFLNWRHQVWGTGARAPPPPGACACRAYTNLAIPIYTDLQCTAAD